jgi:hypothetical protein
MTGWRKAAPWVVTIVALGAAAFLLMPRGSHHPDPRPDAQALAMTVLPATDFGGSPDAAEAYDIARQIPQTLDGLYCHCHCRDHMRHRSLLTCFQSDHASQCDICMGEARLAFQMLQEGRTLDEIRTAVDKTYGS